MKIGQAMHFKAEKGVINVSKLRKIKGSLLVNEDLPSKKAFDMAKDQGAELIVVVDRHQNALGVVIPGEDRLDLYWCTVGCHLSYEYHCPTHACDCVEMPPA